MRTLSNAGRRQQPEDAQIGNTAVCGKWKWVGVETRPEVALGRRCSQTMALYGRQTSVSLPKPMLTSLLLCRNSFVPNCIRKNEASRSCPCCAVVVTQSCPTLCNPMDCSLTGSSDHGDSPGKNTGVGCHALLQGIFPGIEPMSPTLQTDSLPSEPPGKHLENLNHFDKEQQPQFPTQEEEEETQHEGLQTGDKGKETNEITLIIQFI